MTPKGLTGLEGGRRREVEGRKDDDAAAGPRTESDGLGGGEACGAPRACSAAHPGGPLPAADPAPGLDSGQADAREPPRRYYAALDLGTNNCRLLVAQPTRRG